LGGGEFYKTGRTSKQDGVPAVLQLGRGGGVRNQGERKETRQEEGLIHGRRKKGREVTPKQQVRGLGKRGGKHEAVPCSDIGGEAGKKRGNAKEGTEERKGQTRKIRQE